MITNWPIHCPYCHSRAQSCSFDLPFGIVLAHCNEPPTTGRMDNSLKQGRNVILGGQDSPKRLEFGGGLGEGTVQQQPLIQVDTPLKTKF